jgi:cytochrome c551/c552
MDIPLYHSYMQPMHHQAYAANGIATPPIKQEFYAEDEINPFSMSYASIACVDVSTTVAPSYQDVAAAYVSTTTAAQPPIPYARSYSYPQ